MASPGWPERNKATRSFRQLRRFLHVINSDKVFGTHVGGLVAEVFHAVASLDQRHALGGKTLPFDRADFGAILVTLAALLRLFVLVDIVFDVLVGAIDVVTVLPKSVSHI